MLEARINPGSHRIWSRRIKIIRAMLVKPRVHSSFRAFDLTRSQNNWGQCKIKYIKIKISRIMLVMNGSIATNRKKPTAYRE